MVVMESPVDSLEEGWSEVHGEGEVEEEYELPPDDEEAVVV
jgi:hypothetical protein